MTAPSYLMDADVFIAAKNLYYAFDICPGFWSSLAHHARVGNIHSLDMVKTELLAARRTEVLEQWVTSALPSGFFLDTSTEDVLAAYAKVMLWVQGNPQYFNAAKAKFATEADGWLVAFAIANDAVVVTNEKPRPESKHRILLPDVCDQFGVMYRDTFFPLRQLEVRLSWDAPDA